MLAHLELAVGSDGMLGIELKSGAVREVLADWRLPSIDIWAVFPTGQHASAKACAFAAFIERDAKGGGRGVAAASLRTLSQDEVIEIICLPSAICTPVRFVIRRLRIGIRETRPCK